VFAFLALASAACYGAADFLGGLASKRASTLAIVVVSQLTGLLLLLVAFPFLPAASPDNMDFVWGAVAGLTGGTGVALLYRALAIGVMAVVAPTTAVCAVVIPVLVAIGLGERPGIVTIGGIVLAIIAIALVSQSDHPEPVLHDQRAGSGASAFASAFTLALLSGVAIGLFFIALARTTTEAGVWPLVAARAVSVSLFAAMALLASQSLRLSGGTLGIVVAGGSLDMIANLLYMIATHSGPLSVVVTLASLYPASTVLLARVVLYERLSWRQWVGVGCEMIAVMAIVR
jgi:drug/metabolite transporter (DMT)-like permease